MSRLIRNFSIIAHIDHGKTTLTDGLLRLTHTVTDREFQERLMDSNPIERQRGITIKLAPVRMEYPYQGETYQLNLIDTPGHVDFGYEVSRSLAACEGGLLVVDATQGVQAQTLTNYDKAAALGLTIIPVINKIDIPTADVEATTLELMESFGFDESAIVKVSAKTGLHLEDLLAAIIERIPAPQGKVEDPLRALIMTSQFENHRGAVAYVRVVDGVLKTTDQLALCATAAQFRPLEVGIFQPALMPVPQLLAGEVGYVATGIKEPGLLKIGDTLTAASQLKKVAQLPGYSEPTPMVYLELYPIDGDEFYKLQDSIAQFRLRDAAIRATGTYSSALGQGLRVGFLGILHAEIVLERLRQEFDLDLIATAPTVTYQVTLTDGSIQWVHTPAEMPESSQIKEVAEPMTEVSLYTPQSFSPALLSMARLRRAELMDTQAMGSRTKLILRMPLSEVITDFHDQVKSISSGFASVEYQVTDYQPVKAVKVTILLNKEPVEPLSFICVESQATHRAKALVTKLKDTIPRQMFEVPIQAAIGGSIIARETLKAYRKDVTAKLYGGDVTRRQKLLKKQAKGKKRLKQFGKVQLNQEAFLAVLERES